jgi:hypothetical protein
LASIDLYRHNSGADASDRCGIGHIQACSTTLVVRVIYQLANLTHNPFFDGTNFFNIYPDSSVDGDQSWRIKINPINVSVVIS